MMNGTWPTSLTLTDVRKSYGSLAVIHGIDLTIGEGEFVVFVGPSGCGKSTLLRMIAGLEEVTDGEVAIKGRDVTDLDPSERGIAMVFQSYALYPHMTVRDNLAFGLKMSRTDAAEIVRRVEHAAAILKIEPLLDRRPGQLSGGQRQRVAIGRAIVRKPDVFLFDEPLSNLDAELRVSMRIEIARLHRELGNTMIYVTHDQTEAMTLADRIVILRDGRIEQVGSPRQVYQDPENTFVAGFIGSPRMNLIEGTWSQGAVWVGETPVPAPDLIRSPGENAPVTFGIRPEHILIASDDPAGLPAVVEFTEYLGGTCYVYCRLSGGQAVTIESKNDVQPANGDRLRLNFPAARSFLFDNDGRRLR
ncbi:MULTISPECIES: ABC transporter ATP-binding protein [Agrobacterium]|uniref:Sn-glycerol-3-phosphate ABC transporter ATP-binding protein UgpC n=1 Tax=Agrobacterium tumefaciens TaxID=358 RepID=A0AAE6BH52_AGRTU|nr:sn-glycerol-3-phosphate ABC transporter ATP-binding protein UgpC [Agrobacterium tumefaciens]QCL82750.1 sn-glycerol-3-phosphate ABC transporter ATP-binding protein UgpC [Agrobacterium tumefaciens]